MILLLSQGSLFWGLFFIVDHIGPLGCPSHIPHLLALPNTFYLLQFSVNLPCLLYFTLLLFLSCICSSLYPFFSEMDFYYIFRTDSSFIIFSSSSSISSTPVTNFIWPYLHKCLHSSHGLRCVWKPSRRSFKRCPKHVKAINTHWDIS